MDFLTLIGRTPAKLGGKYEQLEDSHMVQAFTPPQSEIMAAGLLDSGFNCVLQMPTGSGKTWLAEQAIDGVLATKRRAIYLTPLRALADELMTHWQGRFAPHRVGVFTGDYGASGRAYPVPFSQAALLVMTPERLDACTRDWRSHWHWLPDVDLVVVDEFHLLGEAQRGARLEGALLRLRRLNPFARIVALSATLGNRVELAHWLDAVEYASSWRPVPLTWRIVRYKRALDKPQLLATEAQRTVDSGGKSLVFVQSRRRAEELATYLRSLGLRALHHHAGLSHDQRQHVEGAFRGAETDVLVATATLEMGINLPARQVILYDLQRFDGYGFAALATNTVWQRAGRAGRRGLDTEGEAVLMAPSWDRSAERYLAGRFEPILSQLSDPAALAEQIVAEVASGLARTPAQLQTALNRSLAAQQARLPKLTTILKEMEQAGLLVRKLDENGDAGRVLAATPLARVAVRHLLAPATVLTLRRALEDTDRLTFFDLLLVVSAVTDCEPMLAVDFEELDALAAEMEREVTDLLHRPVSEVIALLGVSRRRLLAGIKMALAIRWWTRLGDGDAVAQRFDCYPFEVRRLQESMVRLLAAMKEVAVLTMVQPDKDAPIAPRGEIPTGVERIGALLQMVTGGLDEDTVTLTLVPGIGPTLAKRLAEAGIEDIEMLAQAETETLAGVRGLSEKRATTWVEAATSTLSECSALRYREIGRKVHLAGGEWPDAVEPYRLRRALELTVQSAGAGRFLVSGGLEPHWVTTGASGLQCDCVDASKGNRCKHALATQLQLGEPLLRRLAHRVGERTSGTLDLFGLWMEHER